jgi:hypothetical protein
MKRITGIGDALNRGLRRLDTKLGIDHAGRSEWVWAVPGLTFLGTLAMILYMGMRTEMGIGVAIPVGLIGAAFMGGLSIAYMTPVEEGPDTERGHEEEVRVQPRRPAGDGPPAWWSSVPTPPTRSTADQEAERETVGAR